MRPSALGTHLFDRLRLAAGEALVSIYVPTHAWGRGIGQDPIRLKNGLSRADGLLDRAGWKPREREALLSRATELLEDAEFWSNQKSGLGLFIGDRSEPTAVALSGGAPERSVLSHVFHLRPLVASVDLLEISVLALTKNSVQLYLASEHRIESVDVDLPDSFDDVNWFVDREKQRQQHFSEPAAKSSGHGHEGGYRKEDLARYLRAVADAVAKPTGRQKLIVLGDDNLADRFVNICEQDAVSPSRSGLQDATDKEEVHRLATPTIANMSASLVQDQIESARSHLGTGGAITNLAESLMSAVGGRIATLLIDNESAPMWGAFSPVLGQVSHHEDQEPFSVDLLDRLVVEALGTGATVINSPGPIDGHTFVAMLRY